MMQLEHAGEARPAPEEREVVAFDKGAVSDLVARMFSQSTISVDVVERESMVSDRDVVEFHLSTRALSSNEKALWEFVEGLAGYGDLPLGWAGEPVAYLLVAAFAASLRVPFPLEGAA